MIPAELVEDARSRHGVPGLAVGVLHGDEQEVAGFGVTSTRNPLPVEADTLFQIGSITKGFLAAAVMKLCEAGLIDLDEPIGGHVPELRMADPSVAERVTMRHLLSHTGGWVGDYFESLSRGDDALALMVSRLDRLPQEAGLGERFSYNNSGFYIAGRAIEVVSGEPFEAALRQLVLVPLGLDHSYLFPEEVMTHRFAVGHDSAGEVAEPWALPRTATAAGGLVSTVGDLFAYARSYWTPGALLSSDSIAEMRTPVRPTGKAPNYAYPMFGDAAGLGWFLIERDGHRMMLHSGGTNGQLTRLLISPEDRFALVILTNHAGGLAVADELQEQLLGSALGVSLPRPEPLRFSPDELAEYAGEYRGAMKSARIEVVDGGLVETEIFNGGFPEHDTPPRPAGGPVRLEFEAKDATVWIDPPKKGEHSEFVRGPDGRVEWYRLEGRLLRRSD